MHSVPRRKDSRVRLRVHFTPVGFEVERIVVPAVVLRAEVVVLFTLSKADRARNALERTVGKLRAARIRPHVIECDIWDPPTVIDQAGGIVASAPEHEYFFNVSTGAKTACIGGTIAAMFWPIQPYYQPVDHEAKPLDDKYDYPTKGAPTFVPTFATSVPDRIVADSLSFMVHVGRPLAKREYMAHLKEADLIGPRAKDRVSPQALHAQADVILRRLEAWGFVIVEGRGRRKLVHLTDMGIGGERMFRHLLHPLQCPKVLES